MRQQSYTILEIPIPWARPVTNRTTGHVYDSQFRQKKVYKDILYEQHKDEPLWYGPIELEVRFFLKLPVNLKAKRILEDQHYHKVRPDTSNLVKFLEDAAMGVLYDDDCIIARIIAEKIYDAKPRTEFTIKGLCYEEEVF